MKLGIILKVGQKVGHYFQKFACNLVTLGHKFKFMTSHYQNIGCSKYLPMLNVILHMIMQKYIHSTLVCTHR